MVQLEVQVLPTGAQIGVYEIKEVISSGRAGVLYRAWNEHLNTMVALKEYLPSDYAVRDTDGHTVKAKRASDESVYKYGMEKFLEFAEILTDIQQTNVVGVHNVLQFNGTAYLAMDFEEGTLLSKLQATSPSFSENDLKAMLISLLKALQAVHAKDTVHGDIHPSNIIIRHNGEPVLVNFAAARLALAAHSQELLQELRSGFAPAELYHPENVPGPSSDLYSLGATMYYCITRTDPGSILDRVEALNSNQPDPYQIALEGQGTGFSEGLLKAISWMLHPNAEDRPQSAIDVLNILGQDVDISSIPDMNYKKTPGIDEGKLDEQETDSTHKGLLTTTAIVIIALVAVGFWILRQDKPETDSTEVIANMEIDKPVSAQIESVDVVSAEPAEEISMAAAPEIIEQESGEVKQGLAENNIPSTADAVEAIELSESIESGSSTTIIDNPPDKLTIASEQESIVVQERTLEPEPLEEPEQQPVPVSTSEDKKEKIKQYLSTAENHLAELNLTTPVDDNAYMQYQAVLAMEPDNIEANVGLQRIIKLYTFLIEGAIKEQQYYRARIYLDRAETINSDMSDLQRLRKELADAEQ